MPAGTRPGTVQRLRGLYSHEDVERLRRIQQMTAELGLNLAGVAKVLELVAAASSSARRTSSRSRSRSIA